MQLPVFSLIYIFFIVYNIYTYKDFKSFFIKNITLLLFIEICFFQGFFLQIGEWNISIRNIHTYGMLLLSVIYILFSKNKINSNIVLSALLFAVVPIMGLIYQIIFPYDGMVMPLRELDLINWDLYVAGNTGMLPYRLDLSTYRREYMSMLRLIIIVIVMKSMLDRKDIFKIACKVVDYYKFIVVYGYVEFIIKNVVNQPYLTYEITNIFFGAGKHTYIEPRIRGEWYMLQGVTREPSHFVIDMMMVSLVILLIYTIHKKGIYKDNHIKSKIALLFAMIGLMFLTGGFTALLACIVISSSYLVLSITSNKVSFKHFFRVAVLSIGFVLIGGVVGLTLLEATDSYLGAKLGRAIETVSWLLINPAGVLLASGMDGSTLARFTSIIFTGYSVLDRPVFGIGLDATWAHDSVISALSKIGLLGGFLWYRFATSSRYAMAKYDTLFFIVGIVIAQIPIGYHMSVWYVLYPFILELTSVYMSPAENDEIIKKDVQIS